MESRRSDEPSRDVVVCADVLGSFGVTPADVRAQRREYRTAIPPGQEERDLETVLEDVLADARDRTAMVRQLICRSDRGLTCSARYAQRALGRELEAVFASINWAFEWTRTGPAATGRDRLELTAMDPKGRQRETTVTYPQTPLADDNLPVVLQAIDERLLAGTDATIVLLSAGADRWRAALIETDELEALRDRYGQRISAFDRPLLPEFDLEAYVPDDAGDESEASIDPKEATDADPWPAWALERAERRSNSLEATGQRTDVIDDEADAADAAGDEPDSDEDSSSSSVASLIDEAEPERERESASTAEDDVATAANEPSFESSSTATEDTGSATSAPSTEADGFEIRGGSPTISRVNDDGDENSSDRSTGLDGFDSSASLQGSRTETTETPDGDSESGFGTLSGSSKTARVTNDSFGTGDEFETDNDRYSALGLALGAGGSVTVDKLLEDDEFLPELPAAESETVRIEFDDAFDPAAIPEAKASGEQSGFEWVDSGSLETNRISNN